MTGDRSADKTIPHTTRTSRKEPLVSTEALMNAPIGIFTSLPEGRVLSANQTLARMLGYETPEELIESISDIGKQIYATPDDRDQIKNLLETHGETHGYQCQWVRRFGELFWVSIHVKVMWDKKAEKSFYQGFITDITEQKQAEKALCRSENFYRTIFENSATVMFIIEKDTTISLVNSNFEKLMGYSRQEFEGKRSWKEFIHPEDVEWMEKYHYQRREDADAAPGNYEFRFMTRSGELRNGFIHVAMIPGTDQSVVSLLDITGQKQAAAEKDSLQKQFLQAQKMESVGRLAGGVAHEFNNMLSIINGYAEMMTDVLSPSEPLFNHARQIQDAGKRSAVIVRKLLAFARKQVITPEEMNLNESVSGMLKMLEKTIGENIELLWKPAKNLWLIKMDISQLDQILINLVINARDAIHDVGKIIIETKNVEFDKEYCVDHPGFIPGQYVKLAVSDNGCGMSKEVQAKLFEPFFTTKEVGQGTGLGLPTVYGIVKQNQGFVNAYSVSGKGTTFKVYFPRHKGDDTVVDSEKEEEYPAKGHGETILILEDEAEVLGIARIMLEKQGYHVLAAETPNRAMALAEAHDGRIDLLITDVIMPEMNGRDFADQLKTLYPEVKTLFMSGYTANLIAHHNVADEEFHFLEKPFAKKEIAAKVREALSSRLGT